MLFEVADSFEGVTLILLPSYLYFLFFSISFNELFLCILLYYSAVGIKLLLLLLLLLLDADVEVDVKPEDEDYPWYWL